VKERFQKIYSENADSVFRYCFFRVSDRNTAIDLAQDVFTRYWDNLAKGKDIGNDRAFLFTVARNIIIDWYRKKKSLSLESLQEENEDTEEFVIIEDNAKGALDMQNESRFLLDKIKALPATSQHILYMRYIEDLKPREIAEALEIRENTVSVRIHRALEELRKITGYDLE
jgi:RNA polymerase sigma-70 factor (ECF subfamily)